VVACLVAGCATVPPYEQDAVSTAEITRHIKCELRDAVWRDPANDWLRSWNAGLVLTLEVFHTGDVAADTGVVFPVNATGVFIPTLSGGYSGQATRTERISFNESLVGLSQDTKLACKTQSAGRDGRLEGQLGIADLLERAGRTRSTANLTGLTQLDYNLDFIIKSNAGLEPRFTLVPIGNSRSIGGGVKLSNSRSDTQSLKLTLVPPAVAAAPTNRSLAPGLRGGGPAIAPVDEDKLERSKSRNLLESIDDQLRRQNLRN
jgi:hypothetical protein